MCSMALGTPRYSKSPQGIPENLQGIPTTPFKQKGLSYKKGCFFPREKQQLQEHPFCFEGSCRNLQGIPSRTLSNLQGIPKNLLEGIIFGNLRKSKASFCVKIRLISVRLLFIGAYVQDHLKQIPIVPILFPQRGAPSISSCC